MTSFPPPPSPARPERHRDLKAVLPGPAIAALRRLHNAWLDHRYRDRGMPWTLNDLAVRVSPEARLLMGPVYDLAIAKHLSQRVKPGELSINVGANLGVYVLQLAAWAGPDGKVVAFEPNPHARRILKRHLAFNGLENRVTVEPAAVGGEPGRQPFWFSGLDGMSRLVEPNRLLSPQEVESIEVEVVTLDQYWRRTGVQPNWLVIDIEGFEPAALAGARELIVGHPGLGLIVEMHPDSWHLCGYDRETTRALLSGLGLEPVSLAGQQDPLAEHGMVELRRTP